MSKLLAMLATVLLAGTLGFAQAGQAGMQSGQGSMNQAGQNTVRGCLMGSSGHYRLTANDGTTYNLRGQNSELAKNVNKEVEIQTNSKISPGASASGSAAGQSASAHTQTLRVQNVTQVADACQNSGMQGEGQGGQAMPGQNQGHDRP
jgi:hypothetical protein